MVHFKAPPQKVRSISGQTFSAAQIRVRQKAQCAFKGATTTKMSVLYYSSLRKSIVMIQSYSSSLRKSIAMIQSVLYRADPHTLLGAIPCVAVPSAECLLGA